MEYGIDISNYQGGPTTWSAVKADGISFASILQTDTNSDGTPYVNPFAASQASGARSVGIVTGGYHFARIGRPVVDQVGRFVLQLEACGLLANGSLQPTLDIEVSDGTVRPDDFVAEFKREFTARTGTGLIVYANLSWWQTILHPDEWVDNQTWLWLALYNGQPTDTGGWSHPRLAIHQSTDQGAVPGFIGLVDRDETVNGFGLKDLIIGGSTEMPDRLEVWHNRTSGDWARVFSNGVMNSVAASDFAAEEANQQLIVFEVDDSVWQAQLAISNDIRRGNNITIDQATLTAAIRDAFHIV